MFHSRRTCQNSSRVFGGERLSNKPCSEVHEFLMNPRGKNEMEFQDTLTHVTFCHKCQCDAQKIYNVGNDIDLKEALLKAIEGIHPFWTQIRDNLKLRELENKGFQVGEKNGKTMKNMGQEDMIDATLKQYQDLCYAFGDCNKEGMLKALADLRNVAGLMFLRIENPKAFECEET
jgi:hypothetical protein